MHIKSIRTARRMAVAASGMVAAATLVIGAEAASAGTVLAVPPPNPTSAFCSGSPTVVCLVHDGDGIKKVWRELSGSPFSIISNYNGEKYVVVRIEGKYDAFTVTDMRGFEKRYENVLYG